MDEPGISFGKHAEKMGVLSAPTDDVLLEDVFVPDGSRLGEEGKGLKVALGTLDVGRIGIAAQAVGIAEAAFRSMRRATPYLREGHSGAPGDSLQAGGDAD